ncbi:WecB/TagA/CpsF family glycosyltransferase [Rhodopirellula halodulae]|uniref:WecB/TagA/CpsF family glycosyltransferase n=1 Tax=Rhodopirellula halodulae TaxID=2894198 RepID=UPI001E5F25AC|nr:WecB/TagA/CpsF family glycosyltransferase [Rhodopirellula sp. JC737]MCC9656687.1 WecB/TagA/CpsF family glycosyltransferase [Rhodopirellula sp. JC737]
MSSVPSVDSYSSTTPQSVPVVPPSSRLETQPGVDRRSQSSMDPHSPNSTANVSTLPPGVRDTVDVWDIPFDRLDMWQSVDAIDEMIAARAPQYVITANLNYCMLHHKMPELRPITQRAAMVLADGHPIVARSKFTDRPLPERVAGSELIVHLCSRASLRGYRVYFLGGEPGVAEKASARLKAMYPGLQIAGCESPPYRTLSEAEQAEQYARIRDSKTDLLFVAFGQPKGEKWIAEHAAKIGVPVSIQLGASFDFLAGTAKRAPKLFQSVGMEWAYRMMSDPRRLVPRYASNIGYLCSALMTDWKNQVKRWGMDMQS